MVSPWEARGGVARLASHHYLISPHHATPRRDILDTHIPEYSPAPLEARVDGASIAPRKSAAAASPRLAVLARIRIRIRIRTRIRIRAHIVIMNMPPNLRRRVALPLNLALSNAHTRIIQALRRRCSHPPSILNTTSRRQPRRRHAHPPRRPSRTSRRPPTRRADRARRGGRGGRRCRRATRRGARRRWA